MRGSLKIVRIQEHPQNKTNFNDWCDPKYKYLRRRINKHELAEKELNNFEVPVEQVQKASVSSQNSIEILELQQKIKDGYPLLSRKEIRNVKLAFHESLLLNLKEDGFLAACEFIKDLISLDEKLHIQRGKGSTNILFLKSNTAALNSLSNGLTKAELAKKKGKKTHELRSLLDMAIHFSSPENESLHWLAKELYEQCVAVADDDCTAITDRELKAIAKHIFAQFLLDVTHDAKRAQFFVEESMELSIGKYWKAVEIKGKKNDILYFKSCLLLHKILLQMAHEKADYAIEDAIQLYRNALHWAKQTNCTAAEATALMNLVITYIAAGQVTPVLGHLERYMKLCKEQRNTQGLCEGYILLATYHELVGNNELVIQDIQEVLKIAEENKIMKVMAVAHHKLTTFYLMHGKVKQMQNHAINAYSCYVKLDSKLEMEETRCFAGIAQAQEVLPYYLNILLEAEDLDLVEFKTLMLWKTLRIPFFSNVKLFQPEAETNSQLKDRIDTMKNEELSVLNNTRLAEAASHMPITKSQLALKVVPPSSIGLGIAPSQSVLNFQRHMRSAMQGSD